MTEQELFDTVFGRLCDSKDAHYAGTAKWYATKEFMDNTVSEEVRNRLRAELVPPIYEVEAYAELAKDVEIREYDDRDRSKVVGHTKIPAGTTMRIVMASRLGDLGITRNLGTQHGYETRVQPGDGYLTNCRLTKN